MAEVVTAVKWWFPARWFGIHHKHTLIDGMSPQERVVWKREREEG